MYKFFVSDLESKLSRTETNLNKLKWAKMKIYNGKEDKSLGNKAFLYPKLLVLVHTKTLVSMYKGNILPFLLRLL
jgi:hypothetical protein